MRSTIGRLAAVIIAFCLFAAGASVLTVYGDPYDTETAEQKTMYTGPQSSFAYKLFPSQSEYRKTLKEKMVDVYDVMDMYIDDVRTLPIPGIIETCITGKNGNELSGSYVPQGLCMADRYFLVTAYDADKEHNSVIYVIDSEKKFVVSTLTLPHRYHAGGIAFDGERIWLTGDTSDKYDGKPFVQYLEYAAFEQIIEEPLHRITDDEISGKVYIKNKPSFLECDSNMLWVGTYTSGKSTQQGYINGYPIVTDGERVKLDTMTYRVISGIDSSAQGADIFGNFLYVSSSYLGWTSKVKTSFVTMYDITDVLRKGDDLNVSEKEVRRVEVPKMNEEIMIDQGIMYINFESAYDGWPAPVIRTDRILAVRRNLWR